MSKLALIIGIGSSGGTGGACARIFAAAGYDVAVVGRRQGGGGDVVESIKASGGKAKAYCVPDYREASVQQLFKQLKSDWSSSTHRVSIFNAASGFKIAPFLESSEKDIQDSLDGTVVSAWNFSQASIKSFLDAGEPEDPKEAKGTLIFTGATAALKGGAKFSTFTVPKFAIRSLSQTLAREFGPQGIHVAHAVIDGLIVTERTSDYTSKEKQQDVAAMLAPESIAKSYLYLAQQDRSAFTQEIDLRPAKESW